MGTAGIFGSEAEKVTTCTNRSVNGTDLKPGDLLGFPSKSSEGQIGHVWMYIGEGKVVDSSGGNNGRECSAVNIRETSFACGWVQQKSGLFVVRR